MEDFVYVCTETYCSYDGNEQVTVKMVFRSEWLAKAWVVKSESEWKEKSTFSMVDYSYEYETFPIEDC